MRRVQPLDIEYLRAAEGTLIEWTSVADEEPTRLPARAALGSGEASEPLAPNLG